MTTDLERLALAVKQRRAELRRSQVQLWKEDGGPSNTKLTQIESAVPPAPSPSTKTKLEKALLWQEGSVDAILSGGEATVESPPAQPAENPDTTPWTLMEQVDESLARFEAAAAELARAEQEYDSQVRRWARSELRDQKDRAPTAAEVATHVAWSAMHDTREWSRYEMALIEHVFPDYPTDPRVGSTFADLEPFRDRVRRIGPQQDVAGIAPEHAGRVDIQWAAHDEPHAIEDEQGHDENP